jgi:hypothetical protein
MNCPECKKPMGEHTLGTRTGGTLQLDVCQACGGLWFDTHESLKLSAGGTLRLFRVVYGERRARPPKHTGPLSCPRCDAKLVLSHDLAHGNRYQYWRCTAGDHGHFITFFQFLREKGLVRALHAQELVALRKHVDTLLCSDCGEPIRLANMSACARCQAPVCLMDPECVESTIRDAEQAVGSRRDVAPHVAAHLVMKHLGMKDFHARRAAAAAALAATPIALSKDAKGSTEAVDLVDVDSWGVGFELVELLGDIFSLF